MTRSDPAQAMVTIATKFKANYFLRTHSILTLYVHISFLWQIVCPSHAHFGGIYVFQGGLELAPWWQVM